jgi:hypothetical protein
MLDAETGGASTGFTYTAQYGVRRPSTRPDVYRTQFGSISADEYITPMLQPNRNDGNIARRLSRNSFLIPHQTLVRHGQDGMLIKRIYLVYLSYNQIPSITKNLFLYLIKNKSFIVIHLVKTEM